MLFRIARAIHCDRGGAAVSFILAFPIFLAIVAIFVQYALLLNGRTVVQHAAEAAARSAVTALPDQSYADIDRAARMVLTPLSPQANSEDAEAISVRDALLSSGVNVPETYAKRYTYAMDATDVTWPSPDDAYLRHDGREIVVTVKYRFLLTVPLAMKLIGSEDTIAGVSGRFSELSAECRVQTAHGRKAAGRVWP